MPAAACRHLFSINGVKREIYTIPRSPEPPKPQRDAKLRHEGEISACSGPGPQIHQKSQGHPKIPPKIFLNPRPNKQNIPIYDIENTKNGELSAKEPKVCDSRQITSREQTRLATAAGFSHHQINKRIKSNHKLDLN